MRDTPPNELPDAMDARRVDRVRDAGLDASDAARLSSMLSLLGDAVRVRLLYALDLVDELCVGDLALALDISEDAVGYALRLLRTAGLVQTRKAGRTVFYRLVDSFPEPLLEHCLRELIQLSRVAGGEANGAAGPRRREKTRREDR
jgi:ArsR family transcriptional regulator, lead/cadmium/zinc/bismuth-responsive transcriptional repressor